MNPFSVQKGEFGLSSFIQYECNIQNVSLKKNIKKIAFAFSISVSPNILDTRHFSALTITFTDMHKDRTKQKAGTDSPGMHRKQEIAVATVPEIFFGKLKTIDLKILFSVY